MTNTCEIYNSLTSFTGICLVKADNCVASKQTSKQANKQTSKQANKQTSKQASKQANKQTSKQANKQTSKQALDSKQIKENAESPCVVSEDMAHGLFAFFA